MSTDYLKLTTYFGERQQRDGRFVADQLLDLYARERVATSVVLRGIAGFGPQHRLRTDQSLSQSEDLPVVVAAVDEAEKMAGLATRAAALTSHGLITLERAQLATAATVPETAKLTIYLARQLRLNGRPGHVAVCDLLHRSGFSGAVVFLGVDGTVGGRRERARFFSRNIDVPVMIIAVGDHDQATAVLPQLASTLPEALVTVERVELCKLGGTLLARPGAVPTHDEDGAALWQKLMIHTTEDNLHDGKPVHREIVRRLRAIPPSRGVTVLRAIWGFRDGREPHGDKLFQVGRQVPVTTIVVDTPANIAMAFDIVDELTSDCGTVTCERVPALISVDGGHRDGDTTLGRFS